jgi:hypothetical protein
LVGQTGPGIAGFVGLAGGDGEQIGGPFFEAGQDLFSVQRSDIRVADQGISMGGSDLPRNGSDLGEETRGDPDGAPEISLIYQVTSPAPVRTFATRARVKSRSDSLFR